MKLLYVASGHPLQEADDCLMWEKLGIDWFSTGYYATTDKPGNLPLISGHKILEPYVLDLFDQQSGQFFALDKPSTITGIKNRTFSDNNVPNLWQFKHQFLDYFDVIFFNHFVENVERNWNHLHKKKKVVLKTYGMHNPHHEVAMTHLRKLGLVSVRNSPKEHLRCRQYAGHDAIIRGSVVRDEHEMSGWKGDIKQSITFCNYLLRQETDSKHKKRIVSYTQAVAGSGYPSKVYGMGSHFLTHEKKVEALQNNRVNLVVGTPCSNNTYSMVEAWIMGQPIVTFGPKLWQSENSEAHELIENGVTGFWSDNARQAGKYIRNLIEDDSLAKQISIASREKAISVYGREVLSQQWLELFKNIGVT